MSDLEELRDHEKLCIQRRRKGWSQKQYAKKLKISLSTFNRWERGLIPIPKGKLDLGIEGGLQPHEKCLIYRKRCKLNLEDVAEEMGYSRFYINLMELGKIPCDPLLWYWEQ